MKIKIVFFDCDGVLLFGNPWEKLAKAVGLPEELDHQWWSDYYSNKITFDKWMDNIRRFYIKSGLDRKTVDRCFGTRDKEINEEAKELVNYLKSKSIDTAIISSGAESYVSSVAKYFDIKCYRFNTVFVYDKNDKFVKIKTFGEDPDVKVAQIKEVCDLLKIKPQESVFIGDSSNDYKAFELTGKGIMYGSHPKIEKLAWKKVKDLREIIKIIDDENGNKSKQESH